MHKVPAQVSPYSTPPSYSLVVVPIMIITSISNHRLRPHAPTPISSTPTSPRQPKPARKTTQQPLQRPPTLSPNPLRRPPRPPLTPNPPPQEPHHTRLQNHHRNPQIKRRNPLHTHPRQRPPATIRHLHLPRSVRNRRPDDLSRERAVPLHGVEVARGAVRRVDVRRGVRDGVRVEEGGLEDGDAVVLVGAEEVVGLEYGGQQVGWSEGRGGSGSRIDCWVLCSGLLT